MGEVRLKRYKFDVYKKLSEIALKKSSIQMVFDQGFIQIEKGQVKGVYMLCLYHTLHSGFIKFTVDDDLHVLDSLYYALNPNLEARYDAETGNFICQYVSYPDGDDLVYNKIVNNKKVDEYRINKNDVKAFPELESVLSYYVEGDLEVYKFFNKVDKEITYVEVR